MNTEQAIKWFENGMWPQELTTTMAVGMALAALRAQRGREMTNIPMPENDAGASTIGGYFEKLLLKLWDEQEGFSGKRPFGNSGWDYDVYTALIKTGAISGKLSDDGYVEEFDQDEADKAVKSIIDSIFHDHEPKEVNQ